MGHNIVEKLIASHLVSGEMKQGSEISIQIDQTLTQDALGTMAYLQFEAMGIPKVKTKLSVSYVDHLTLQQGFENADDHKYLRTVAAKYGILYSKPGNGICHQLHLERLAKPGLSLLGSDSHTPTSGAVGMLAIGAGGLDVAVAMAGRPFFLQYPKIIRVNLQGKLQPWTSAKDVILELLKKLTTKGNVGSIIEYGGVGILDLSVPERATIANMGAELGVTTSLFPSDNITLDFLSAQSREDHWEELMPDSDAIYDQTIDMDLSIIEPNIALPHSPDRIKRVREIAGLSVDQVLVGSCTNASYKDMMTVAAMLEGRKVHPEVSFGVSAGSRQVINMIASNGALTNLIESGARIFEPTCGFCAGYGQSPHSGAVSLRTNNRNFKGRSGTKDAKVYLVSPETATASALTGKITDPRDTGIDYKKTNQPKQYFIDDSMFAKPSYANKVFHGPNLKPPPRNTRIPNSLKAVVTIKLGNKITTDHIIPAGPVSRYRSNIQKSSEFAFTNIDGGFVSKCKEAKAKALASVIIAGTSYGQGSSREHAALCPMYLGVRIVIAKAIERIHMANLINFGIAPLLFKNKQDYDLIQPDDNLEIENFQDALMKYEIAVTNKTKQYQFYIFHNLTTRQLEILLCGGLLNYTKN